MREGLVEMRKLSLYHSVLAAILNKLKVVWKDWMGLRLRGKGQGWKGVKWDVTCGVLASPE
jgi:hypothetical protein